MSYFRPSFLQFFTNLDANNSKEWFDKNRKTYEKEVKEPFADFVDHMITRIQHHEPDVQIKASDAIVRINKDTRFSKDKTPYNTHVAANISKYGKKNKSYPGFFFQFSPKGVAIYGGAYMVEKDVLQNIRQKIADNPKAFSAVYSNRAFAEKFGRIQGEQHKRLPAEFLAVAEKEPLIANKQFYYSAHLNPDIITSANLAEHLMEYYLSAREVSEFLKKAIGK